MENEELRELTASERLTLEQEYEMQNSWHTDENSTAEHTIKMTVVHPVLKCLCILQNVRSLYWRDWRHTLLSRRRLMLWSVMSMFSSMTTAVQNWKS